MPAVGGIAMQGLKAVIKCADHHKAPANKNPATGKMRKNKRKRRIKKEGKEGRREESEVGKD